MDLQQQQQTPQQQQEEQKLLELWFFFQLEKRQGEGKWRSAVWEGGMRRGTITPSSCKEVASAGGVIQ